MSAALNSRGAKSHNYHVSFAVSLSTVIFSTFATFVSLTARFVHIVSKLLISRVPVGNEERDGEDDDEEFGRVCFNGPDDCGGDGLHCLAPAVRLLCVRPVPFVGVRYKRRYRPAYALVGVAWF